MPDLRLAADQSGWHFWQNNGTVNAGDSVQLVASKPAQVSGALLNQLKQGLHRG
jgi:hypothetical protein